MKKLVIAVALLLGATTFAQEKNLEELKAEKAKKSAELAKLQGEVDALKGLIATYPGWRFGGMGTVGINLSGYKNWYSNAMPSSSTANIGIVVNGFADLIAKDYFWKNALGLNLGWTKLDDESKPNQDKDFKTTTDALNFSSLFGYNITETIASSALLQYRTTVTKNFNDPGYLDFGVGATWTPMSELVVVVHPLNYNYVFASTGSTFESSLGCKLMAEYNKDFGFLKYRSNFTTFLSYKSSDYSNWTWVNSVGLNVWKGLGVGFEGGLRQNKQEAFSMGDLDNKLQSYWLIGISYGL